MSLITPHPAAWYPFGPTRALHKGPVSRELLGKQLVAFRTERGTYSVLDARCSHFRADLGKGCVVGETIVCPFHGWRYDPSGKCVEIPAEDAIPRTARQRCYPAVERHGHLYFFNGPEALFPLPFFVGEDPGEFVAAKPLLLDGHSSWYLVNGNAFDVQHFHSVHGRKLVRSPVVDMPHEFARRIRLTFEIVGNSVFDKLLRRFVGRHVDVAITVWGGAVIELTGKFPGACSRMMMFNLPTGPNRCLLHVFVYAKQSRLGLIGNLCQLWVRRLFTHGFLAGEFDSLAGIRFNPAGTVPSDQCLLDFLQWVSQLPQGEHWSKHPDVEEILDADSNSLLTEQRA